MRLATYTVVESVCTLSATCSAVRPVFSGSMSSGTHLEIQPYKKKHVRRGRRSAAAMTNGSVVPKLCINVAAATQSATRRRSVSFNAEEVRRIKRPCVAAIRALISGISATVQRRMATSGQSCSIKQRGAIAVDLLPWVAINSISRGMVGRACMLVKCV